MATKKQRGPAPPMKNRAMRWSDDGWADVLYIGMPRMRELVELEAGRIRRKAQIPSPDPALTESHTHT
jgi:hypothetical protein